MHKIQNNFILLTSLNVQPQEICLVCAESFFLGRLPAKSSGPFGSFTKNKDTGIETANEIMPNIKYALE